MHVRQQVCTPLWSGAVVPPWLVLSRPRDADSGFIVGDAVLAARDNTCTGIVPGVASYQLGTNSQPQWYHNGPRADRGHRAAHMAARNAFAISIAAVRRRSGAIRIFGCKLRTGESSLCVALHDLRPGRGRTWSIAVGAAQENACTGIVPHQKLPRTAGA